MIWLNEKQKVGGLVIPRRGRLIVREEGYQKGGNMEPNEKKTHLELSEESVKKVNGSEIPEGMKARVRDYAKRIVDTTERIDKGDITRAKLIVDIKEYEDNIFKVFDKYDMLPKTTTVDGTKGMTRGVSSVGESIKDSVDSK